MGAWRVMFLSLGLPGESIQVLRAAFRTVFAVICMGLNKFLVFFVCASSFFAIIYIGFKELLFFLFDSTWVLRSDLQKHFVK